MSKKLNIVDDSRSKIIEAIFRETIYIPQGWHREIYISRNGDISFSCSLSCGTYTQPDYSISVIKDIDVMEAFAFSQCVDDDDNDIPGLYHFNDGTDETYGWDDIIDLCAENLDVYDNEYTEIYDILERVYNTLTEYNKNGIIAEWRNDAIRCIECGQEILSEDDLPCEHDTEDIL